ncbi:hypothetical protein F5Y01DRAFT_316993 [Xylaria sp. FL0043]|nr:hypothetical protein F5Y01DRAFT_316993 [Xylaria sp. FL0043]
MALAPNRLALRIMLQAVICRAGNPQWIPLMPAEQCAACIPEVFVQNQTLASFGLRRHVGGKEATDMDAQTVQYEIRGNEKYEGKRTADQVELASRDGKNVLDLLLNA